MNSTVRLVKVVEKIGGAIGKLYSLYNLLVFKNLPFLEKNRTISLESICPDISTTLTLRTI